MTQTTLSGERISKWYCTHCPWIGFNPKIEIDDDEGASKPMEFHVCPKCGWVCYDEEEAPKWMENYKILEKKLSKTRVLNACSS